MCGRYISVGEEERDAVQYLIAKLSRETAALTETAAITFNDPNGGKDAFPQTKHPVILPGGNSVCVGQLFWGFSNTAAAYKASTSLINARCESVQSSSFWQPFARRRCIIPVRGYYEWSSERLPIANVESNRTGKKSKYLFSPTDSQILLLGGLWRQDVTAPDGAYVILTMPARQEYQTIHDRMPLLLTFQNAYSYLFEPKPISVFQSNSAIVPLDMKAVG